jgi:hypothetical protein
MLLYHFHPKVVLNPLDGHRFQATRDGKSLLLETDSRCKARLVVGDRHSPQGWYSPYFSIKVPTTTLVLDHTVKADTQLLTRFHIR